MINFLKIAKKINFSVRSWPQIARKFSNFLPFKAEASVDNRFIVLQLSKSVESVDKTAEKFKYPLVWLRDNCQCSECYHAPSQSRTINWETFNLENATPKSISIEKHLKIVWNDNHASMYDLKWLYERNFSAGNRAQYLNNVYRQQPRLWSKDTFVLEKFQYNDVLQTDDGLYAWLKSLQINGVAMIKNAPLNETECRNVVNRVGFIRRTHYGEEFIIRARGDETNNVAYSSAPLQTHTDLPYYEYNPGVSLLHCIVQSKSAGAFNLLVDGYYVAERLKEEDPEAFICLSQTLVNWSDYGEENGNRFQTIFRAPVICLDREGNVDRINQSIPQRDSFFSVDVERVDQWYAALALFVRLLHDESVKLKTEPGDILAFSNIRLLHGRTGYVDSNGNTRHVVGAYIDWDEIYSRLRVLSSNTHSI